MDLWPVKPRSGGVVKVWGGRMQECVAIEQGRRLAAERPRVPGPGQSAQGESGPKARPTGVVDGQRVDIPVPVCGRPYRSTGTNRPKPDRFGGFGCRKVSGCVGSSVIVGKRVGDGGM